MYYLQASKALFKSLSDARKKVDMSYVERHPTDDCPNCPWNGFCAEHEKQYRPKPVVERVQDHPYRGEQPKEPYGYCDICQVPLRTGFAWPYDEVGMPTDITFCLDCKHLWNWHQPTLWQAIKYWIWRGL